MKAPSLQELLDQVLALPEAAGRAGELLRAYRAGDTSPEVLEGLREQFRRGGEFYDMQRRQTPALLALGWAANAVTCDAGGPAFDRTKATSMRYAAEALAEHERNQRPTDPCGPPDADDDEPIWDPDPAGIPAH